MAKDSLDRPLTAGDIVVVKPTSRVSFMGVGFVKKDNGYSTTVRSFRKTSWRGNKKALTGIFEAPSVFLLRNAKDMRDDHQFPEGFPEELKQEYINEFLTRNTTSS